MVKSEQQLLQRTLRLVIGNHQFSLDVSLVTLSTIASQAVLLLTSLALSRLYAPAMLGLYSVAFGVASLIAVVATLELDTAVTMAADEDEAHDVAVAAITCAAGLSALTLVVLCGVRFLTRDRWFGSDPSATFTVPAATFALAAWSSLRYLHARTGHFRRISAATVGNAAVQGAGQLGAGVVHPSAFGLMAGYLGGRVVSCLWLLGRLRVDVRRGVSRTRTTVRHWLRFSLMTTPVNVLNVVGVAAIAPFTAAGFGLTFAGLFSFALRILAAPSAIVGQAVQVAFFPRIAELDRSGASTAQPIQRAATGLLLVAVPSMLPVLIVGPDVFAALFGSRWRGAGEIAAVLSPWLALQLVSSPLSIYITVKRRWGQLMALSLIETGARLAPFAIGTFGGTSWDATVAYSIVGVLISANFLAWTFRLAGTSVWRWARANARYLAAVSALVVGLEAGRRLGLAVDGPAVAAACLALFWYALHWLRRAGRHSL